MLNYQKDGMQQRSNE